MRMMHHLTVRRCPYHPDEDKFMHTLIRIIRNASALICATLALAALNGCAGTNTFQQVARAGDTVAMAAGWKQNFTHDTITVTIHGSDGSTYVYLPNDPAVRAIVNLYPDPLSSILVSPQIGTNLTPFAQTYALTTNTFTNGDSDWWQTTVFIDLPTNMPVGNGYIEIATDAGEYARSSIAIVSGTGTRGTFDANPNGPMTPTQLASLERVSHQTVSFSGSTVPYALEVRLSHAPDAAHSGSGYVHVVNTRGDVKSANWNDTGTELRVVLMPAKQQALGDLVDFKFQVAGGIANLSVVSVTACDSNGATVSGISASIN
jgi:hypothetical protein